MYWAGGCPSRISRSSKPYPGARRFMEVPAPPINWKRVASNIIGASIFFALLGFVIWLMLLAL